jgi:hypothetical protein
MVGQFFAVDERVPWPNQSIARFAFCREPYVAMMEMEPLQPLKFSDPPSPGLAPHRRFPASG